MSNRRNRKPSDARRPAPLLAPEDIIEGLRYADFEPFELPDEARKIVGSVYDVFEDRYWDLVDEFWDQVIDEVEGKDISRMLRLIPDGHKLVQKGLREKEKEGDKPDRKGQTPDDEASEGSGDPETTHDGK